MSEPGDSNTSRLLRTDSEQKLDPKQQVEKVLRKQHGRTRSSVLVIDEDPLMLTAMSSVLDMQGHRAVMARTESIAIEQIQAGQFDVIVLSIEDLEAGCDFAKKLRGFESTRDIPIVFLVPENSSDWGQELAKHGGVFRIEQPIEPGQLTEVVEKALWMPHVAQSHAGTNSAHMTRQSDWIKL